MVERLYRSRTCWTDDEHVLACSITVARNLLRNDARRPSVLYAVLPDTVLPPVPTSPTPPRNAGG